MFERRRPVLRQPWPLGELHVVVDGGGGVKFTVLLALLLVLANSCTATDQSIRWPPETSEAVAQDSSTAPTFSVKVSSTSTTGGSHPSPLSARLTTNESGAHRQQRSARLTSSVPTATSIHLPQRRQTGQFLLLEPHTKLNAPAQQQPIAKFSTQDALPVASSIDQQQLLPRIENIPFHKTYQQQDASHLPLYPGGKIREPPGDRHSFTNSWSVAPASLLQPPANQHQVEARDWSDSTINYLAKEQQQRQPLNDLAGYRCKKRSLGTVLQSAKNLLTSGFASLERYATPGNMMLSSSLLAAVIPLAVLLMPDSASASGGGDSSSGNNQRRVGSYAAGNELTSSRFSLQGRVDSVMGWIERSVEHLPNFPRLHPQECVKRSICEAHNAPDKYGAIGFILRLFFPATNLSSTDRMDDMEYKVINKYRHAAGFGLNRRLENNGTGGGSVCKEKYEDCLVSLLDVGQTLMDVFLK